MGINCWEFRLKYTNKLRFVEQETKETKSKVVSSNKKNRTSNYAKQEDKK